MILFKKIKYKNFLSTGNQFTEIALNKHRSTLIVGENGAGKSSILDALCFSLYGKPFRKINKGQLVNSINEKGTLVEIEFAIGKREYIIRRGIKPNVFEIFQDGKLLNQNAESKDYQAYLETNILKLNFKSFSQIVILGSASFVPFMQLPAAHRREIIEDLLDIEIFSKMNNLLKDRIFINKSKLSEADHKIDMADQKVTLFREHIQSLKQNNDELIEAKQTKVKQLKKQLKATITITEEVKQSIGGLLDQIADRDTVEEQTVDVEVKTKTLVGDESKCDHEINFFNTKDSCPTCKQNIEDKHRVKLVKEIEKKKDKIAQSKKDLANQQSRLSTRLQEIKVIDNQIKEKQKQLSEYVVQVQTNGSFIKGLLDEIETLSKNTKQIDINNEQIAATEQELAALQAEKEELVKDKQAMDIAASLLKDTGIKTKIVRQYIPVMNKLINKYLAAMDFFVNFELNENFEEKIKSRFRDEFSYESFSEGEKLRIDLSLLFTWRAIAKLRNSASTNLLIMDEVFDSSLDMGGTEEFLKILNGVTSDTNVFIISHKGDQLFDKFEYNIKFEKHKNFSRIA